MELRQLASFLQVAASGSFSAASGVLNLAQPALSRQIKALEIELGVPLFHRTGRGVVLTASGRVFAQDARAILGRVDDARRKLAAFKTGKAGGAVIGLPPTVGRMLTLPLTRQFHSSHALVSLQIVEGFSGTMVEWLRSGRIDLAILYDDPGLSTVQAEPVVVEDLCLVSAPATGPLQTAGPVPFATLATRPLVMPTLRHGLRRLVSARAEADRLALDFAFEIDSLPSMIDAVRQGLGWTVLPRSAIQPELAAGVLEAWPISDPPLRRTLVTATAAQRSDAMLLHELSRLVRERMLAECDVAGWRPVRARAPGAA